MKENKESVPSEMELKNNINIIGLNVKIEHLDQKIQALEEMVTYLLYLSNRPKEGKKKKNGRKQGKKKDRSGCDE